MCLHIFSCIVHGLFDLTLSSRRKLVFSGLLAGRRLPVHEHLERKNSVEDEAGDETIEDDFVGDFLQSREDAGEGAEEVGEDLLDRVC